MKNTAVKKIVFTTLKQSKHSLSTKEILAVIHDSVTDRTLRRWLTLWEAEGLIRKIGNKKSMRYKWIDSYDSYNNSHNNSFDFLHAVPEHRRTAVVAQIRDMWTHASTSIEGNTLSLGDTLNILEYGLTISGKPLKEHQEIIGHAKAIEQIYTLVKNNQQITKEDIFELHKSVQTEIVMDIYKPIGEWKVEPNGCNAVTSDNKPIYIEYAHPIHVNKLMLQFVEELNQAMPATTSVNIENAVAVYAKIHIGFVHIHPFWDGNGRLARLISNIPLLKAGLPPLVIDELRRVEYIKSLSTYQIKTGTLDSSTGVWPSITNYESFLQLCKDCYKKTYELINKAEKVL